MKTVALFAILIGLCQIAFAMEAPRPYIHDDDLSAERVVDAVARVRASFDVPGAQGLSEIEQSQLNQILDQLVALYHGDARPRRSTAKAMQKQANTILLPQVANNDAGNDVVCRRVMRVGTRIPDVECRTRAERAREQDAASEMVHRFLTSCSRSSAEPSCVATP